ncbi:MAG: HU family DNA-binding protein [Alphaproteobacteria bacterium]
MTRSELVERLSTQYPSLYMKEIEKSVEIFFREIEKTLANGDRVELRGFGSFGVKSRASRKARNPRNGETVMVQPKRTPFFKMGKKLFDNLNENDPLDE